MYQFFRDHGHLAWKHKLCIPPKDVDAEAERIIRLAAGRCYSRRRSFRTSLVGFSELADFERLIKKISEKSNDCVTCSLVDRKDGTYLQCQIRDPRK
jgi:hypothetical protein